MPKKLTIEEMQEIAKGRGGKCLSTEYINSKTELQWECAEGHQWMATFDALRSGSWCRTCSGRGEHSIEELRRIAANRGGECLSEGYTRISDKYLWRCSLGHEWYAVATSIVHRNSWCPECAPNRKQTLENMNALALSRKGKFLSGVFEGVNEKYRWECDAGHSWTATANSIIIGRWCPTCTKHFNERLCRVYFEGIFRQPFPTVRPEWLRNSKGNRMELDGYCENLRLAFEYQGVQHYRRSWFNQTASSLQRRIEDDKRKAYLCQQNNICLIAIPYIIKSRNLGEYILDVCRKKGVPVPADIRIDEIDLSPAYSPKLIQEMQEIASARKGFCLSKHYGGAFKKLEWQCAKRHKWFASPNDVKNNKSWCPECAPNKKNALSYAQELAHKHDGKCISASYESAHQNLTWRCRDGHDWEAPINRIIKGHWCPECAGNKPKNISEMRSLADSKGGKFLSKELVGVMRKYDWQCSKGHQWSAKANSIINGSWCPHCAGLARLSIEKMEVLAREKGGRCLSMIYTNTRTALNWQCAFHHQWSDFPYNIIRGRWCPTCARDKRRKQH